MTKSNKELEQEVSREISKVNEQQHQEQQKAPEWELDQGYKEQPKKRRGRPRKEKEYVP